MMSTDINYFWSTVLYLYFVLFGVLFFIRYYLYDPEHDNNDNPFAETNRILINYKYVVKGEPFRKIMRLFGLAAVFWGLFGLAATAFQKWGNGSLHITNFFGSISPQFQDGTINKGFIFFVFLAPVIFVSVLATILIIYVKIINSGFYKDLSTQLKKNYPEDFKDDP